MRWDAANLGLAPQATRERPSGARLPEPRFDGRTLLYTPGRLEKLPNVHPGEVLLQEFLKPLGISQNRLARDLKAPPRRLNEIVLGKRSITPDTALRLARYFRTSERFWVGLQVDYDLEEARRAAGEAIEREVQPTPPAAWRFSRRSAP
jgi:antitoxin HigA-1